MKQTKMKMSAYLLGAIEDSLGRLPSTPYDFTKVKKLTNFYPIDFYYDVIPDMVEEEKGNFSCIGQMPNLHTLIFLDQKNTTYEIEDFSFLANCQKLKTLDVEATNFSDCSLLLSLPKLKRIFLPEQEQLTNTEAIKELIKRGAEVQVASERVRMVTKHLSEIIEAIKEHTGQECMKLELVPEAVPGLFDSKFGGLPYWNPKEPYPVGTDGKKLLLLAQLCFDGQDVPDPLPKQGMLQFFIADDEMYGLDFDHPERQRDFRVVYHPEPDTSITKEEVEALELPDLEESDSFPVLRPVAVRMVRGRSYMGPDLEKFQEVFREMTLQTTGEDIGKEPWYQCLEDEDEEEDVNMALETSRHRMLGYPRFTQFDPRKNNSPYDTLLFQMDSELIENEDYILWGDCGIANFFIRREDLK